MSINKWSASLAAIILVVLGIATFSGGVRAQAAPGDLDSSFGQEGKTSTAFTAPASGLAYALALQPDGKMVLAGRDINNFAVMRFNADGTIDESFGVRGRVSTEMSGILYGDEGIATAVVVQPDGKIVVGGSPHNVNGPMDFALVRYNANGTMDTTFGNNGRVVTDIDGPGDMLEALALQPDGKIVAAGNSSRPALARYNSDGSLDGTFGTGGKAFAIMGIDWRYGSITGLKVLADGKIIAAGYQEDSGYPYESDFAVARVNANGTRDTTFGTDGVSLTDFDGRNDTSYGLDLEPGGKIVLAGGSYSVSYSDDPQISYFALARYNANGTPDTDFDVDGKVTTEVARGEMARDVIALADGKLLVGGRTRYDTTNNDFTLVRYLANGQVDDTFQGDGVVTTDFDQAAEDDAYAMSLQPDGKVLLAGNGNGPMYAQRYFQVARYNTDGTLDTSFGVRGKARAPMLTSRATARSVAMQSDGKIVTAGNAEIAQSGQAFAVTRHNTDGSLDTTFGNSGIVTTTVGANSVPKARAYSVLVQPDGKILVGGTASPADGVPEPYNFALVRYNPNGTLDTSFGTGGIVLSNPAYTDVIYDLALQPDGKIVAAGSNVAFGRGGAMVMMRYNQNGSVDDLFGSGGKIINYCAYYCEARSVLVQADGKIVAVGSGGTYPGPDQDFVLARYNSDGSPDGLFGPGGTVVTEFATGSADAYAAALQSDGKIVAVGRSGPDFALARYNTGGSLDSSFGTGGRVTTDFAGAADVAYAVVIQADGKIVAGGNVDNDGYSANLHEIARYNTNGSLDSSFGSAFTGKIVQNFTPLYDLTIQQDGKLVAAGYGPSDFGTGFQLVRYLGGSNPAAPSETPTSTTVASTSTASASATGSSVPAATATTTACTLQFADMPASGPGSTFYSFAHCLACRNIVSGYPCGGPGELCNGSHDPYFRPGLNVTRGQISKMVALAANLGGPTGGQIFEDVEPGSTFYDPIQQLASRGYIGGYPCGRPSEPCEEGDRPYFRPGANTTRGQLSKIVSETALFDEAPGPQKFADVPDDNPFFAWINRLANKGAMGGYACGGPGEECDAQARPYFRPGENVTRGQTAKIVANTFFPNCQTPARK